MTVIICENKGREDKAINKPRQKFNDEISNTEGAGGGMLLITMEWAGRGARFMKFSAEHAYLSRGCRTSMMNGLKTQSQGFARDLILGVKVKRYGESTYSNARHGDYI